MPGRAELQVRANQLVDEWVPRVVEQLVPQIESALSAGVYDLHIDEEIPGMAERIYLDGDGKSWATNRLSGVFFAALENALKRRYTHRLTRIFAGSMRPGAIGPKTQFVVHVRITFPA